MRGVWVYEIGTSPYFTNVAPGEVPHLPTEAPTQEVFDAEEEEVDGGSPGFDGGQQVEYPTYEPDGGQVQVHPVQYQPNQPGNPEVVVVEDTDINVDGRRKAASAVACQRWPPSSHGVSHVPSLLLQPRDLRQQQQHVFPVRRLQGLLRRLLLPLQTWFLWQRDTVHGRG